MGDLKKLNIIFSENNASLENGNKLSDELDEYF
jgi:hypothetical protein